MRQAFEGLSALDGARVGAENLKKLLDQAERRPSLLPYFEATFDSKLLLMLLASKEKLKPWL